MVHWLYEQGYSSRRPQNAQKGVTTYLLENSDWTVIGEAESLAELEPLLKQLTFSEEDKIVAVVDLASEEDGNNALGANGYTAIQMLAEQNIPSVIFSSNATRPV